MARGIMLAKSMIGAILIYTMQATTSMKSTVKEIKRYQRSFTWGNDK